MTSARTAAAVSLGEGNTPAIELPTLARALGVRRVWAKLEQCNPTGSYKDRIAARSLTLARERGARGWIATSSGNAGTSFAAYGRRAQLPGFLCVQPSITREKLVPALALGATVVAVSGVGNDARATAERGLFATVEELAERHDLYLGVTAHAFNDDGMRAVDAIGAELVAQAGALDVVYVPTGGGGLLSAVARGLSAAGSRVAVVAAQPSGCDPIVAYLAGRLAEPVVERCSSGISGLQLPNPPDGALAARAVRGSSGWGTSVSDADIVAAQRRLGLDEGVFVEPAAACALAALIADRAAGRIGADATVGLILTGSGLKDLRTAERDLPALQTAELSALGGLVAAWLS